MSVPPPRTSEETFAPDGGETFQPDGDAATAPPPPSAAPSAAPEQPARYAQRALLGRGGAGEVHSAWDAVLGRTVARKALRQDRNNRLARLRFLREARILARLEHPHIVPVYDLEPDGPSGPLLTMRAIQGRSLDDELADGHLPELRDRLEIFSRVCDAVAHAHARGVIHRDLKPANVMVGAHGTVLVVDWGLARQLDVPDDDGDDRPAPDDDLAAPRLTLVGHIAGTPGYMAPEQAEHMREAGPAADIYGLGATLYHLLTGAAPWAGVPWTVVLEKQARGELVPPRAVRPDVPRELDAVVQTAMARDPQHRHPSVDALRADIDAFLAGKPLASVRYTPAERTARWVRARQRPLAGAAAAILLAAAGAAGVQTWNNQALSEAARVAQAARRDALDRLVDAQLTQARLLAPTDTYAERTALLAARDTAAQRGDPDPAVEAALSMHAHRAPPPLGSWPVLHGGTACGVTASPDGQLGAAWSREGEVAVFRLSTGEIVARADAAGPAAVYFQGASPHLVRVNEREITIGPLDGGVDRRFAIDDPGPILCVRATEDAVTLWRATALATAVRWSTEGVRLSPDDPAHPNLQAYTTDQYFASRQSAVAQCVYDARTGDCRGSYEDILTIDATGYLTSTWKALSLWSHASPTPLWTVPTPHHASGAFFTRDRQLFLSIWQGGATTIHRTADGALASELPLPSYAALAEVPGADAVVVLDATGSVSHWALPTGPPSMRALSGEPWGIAQHAPAHLVATALPAGVALFDDDLVPRGLLPNPTDSPCIQPALSPDGTRVAAACGGQIAVWALTHHAATTDGAWIGALGSPGSTLRLPRFLTHDTLEAWDPTGRARVFDVSSGALLSERDVLEGLPWDLAVSQSGNRLVTGRDPKDRAVRLERPDGTPIVRIPWRAIPFGAAYDPSLDAFWVSDDEGELTRLSAVDGRIQHRFRAHHGLTFDVDAAAGRVATATYTGDVHVFTADGRLLADAGSFEGGVGSVRLRPDGTVVTFATSTHLGMRDLDRWARIEAADAAWRADPDNPALDAERRRLRGAGTP